MAEMLLSCFSFLAILKNMASMSRKVHWLDDKQDKAEIISLVLDSFFL